MVSVIHLEYLRRNDKEKYLEELDKYETSELPQKDRIMKYLKDHDSITPLDAMEKLGVMRLGARIWELIREGWPISTETERSENRYGQMTRYARYRRAA